MAYCLASVFIAIAIIIFCRKYCNTIRSSETYPYSRPNIFYYFKAVLFYLMISLRNIKRRSNVTTDYGSPSYNADIYLMEQPRKLPDKMKAVDAVFFSGANVSGWSLILGMQRKPHSVSTILAYLKIPDEGIYVPKQHPDCLSFRHEDDEQKFKSGGLQIAMVKPMKEWRLKYSGTLKKADDSGFQKEVKIELKFHSTCHHFDFDTDMDQWATSKAFAREPWSRKFFNDLQKHHQKHYEQMGELSGTVTINGNIIQLTMPAFRDHSYAALRDWSLMHRYVFHHIFLDDGSKGVIGMVCQPSTCTRLVCGHWSLPTGEWHPISETDLELEDIGEGGQPPNDYAFQFAAGGIKRIIEVTTTDSAVHYLEWDWEAKLYEMFVEYKVEGITGRGICEWEYKNRKGGRPSCYTDCDPDWTKKLRLQYLAS